VGSGSDAGADDQPGDGGDGDAAMEGLQAELAGAAAAAQETVKKVHESALAALNRDPDAWCMHVVAT